MTAPLIAITTALGLAVVMLGGLYARDRRRRARAMHTSAERILFPFTAHALSRPALDAALRLALAEGATLVPVYLARVPMQMPLDIALPRQCGEGMPLLETIEQRAVALGVPVDARIERGRTLRHALREAIGHERFDRIVVAAASARSAGFQGDDIAWLLDNAPGEFLIIRPGRCSPGVPGGGRYRRPGHRLGTSRARPAGRSATLSSATEGVEPT
jgi:nucleotide-binding universal stress UspA family protein